VDVSTLHQFRTPPGGSLIILQVHCIANCCSECTDGQFHGGQPLRVFQYWNFAAECHWPLVTPRLAEGVRRAYQCELPIVDCLLKRG